MAIIRCKHRTNPFVMVDKGIIENKNLSVKAKGVLVCLLALPENWNVRTGELQKRLNEGIDSIRTVIRELMREGYVRRLEGRCTSGKMKPPIYEVYEIPLGKPANSVCVKPDKAEPVPQESTAPPLILPGIEKPGLEQAGLEKPGPIKPTVINNNINNNKYKKTITTKKENGGSYKNLEPGDAFIGQQISERQVAVVGEYAEEMHEHLPKIPIPELSEMLCEALQDATCFPFAGNDFLRKLNTLRKAARAHSWIPKSRRVEAAKKQVETKESVMRGELVSHIRDIQHWENFLERYVKPEDTDQMNRVAGLVAHFKRILQTHLKRMKDEGVSTEGIELAAYLPEANDENA